jgi:hypothetical protein
MRLGRLVLTHREDLIPILKRFYLGPRSAFLVIAYNSSVVDQKKFEQGDNFRLVPYSAHPRIGLDGQQFRVWIDVAKKFSDIDGWITHDYDLVAKPSDAEIFRHIDNEQYAMIGEPFPVWMPGMVEEKIDTYPFPQGYRYWYQARNPKDENVFKILSTAFPCEHRGITTIVGGYGDFIATRRENILLLDDPKIDSLRSGGIEQVAHTIFAAKGIKAVDMRRFFKTKIHIDSTYLSARMLDSRYDFLHPVKFWPGGKMPTQKDKFNNLKFKLKNRVKKLIRYDGWH